MLFPCEHLVMSNFLQESVVKNVLHEEKDEYDVVSTDSGSGGEGEMEDVNGDLGGVNPPSPPPRPQHTLSKQSFAIDEERFDKVCPLPNTGFLQVGTNETLLVTSNHTASRKPSWRNHRPPVSSYC